MRVIKQIAILKNENNTPRWQNNKIGADACNIQLYTSTGSYRPVAGSYNLMDALHNILPTGKLNNFNILISDSNGRVNTSGISSGCLNGLDFNIKNKISDIENSLEKKISSQGDNIYGDLNLSQVDNEDSSKSFVLKNSLNSTSDIQITKETSFQPASSNYSEEANYSLRNPTNIVEIKSGHIENEQSIRLARIATYDRRIDNSNPGNDWGIRFDVYDKDETPRAGLRMGVDPETGDFSLGISPQNQWRKQFLNYNVTRENISSVNLSSSSYHNLATKTFESGTYMIVLDIDFSAHSSGSLRYIDIQTTSDDNILASMGVPPAGGSWTRLNISTIVSFASSTTIRFRAYQDSGSSLSTSGHYRFLKLS